MENMGSFTLVVSFSRHDFRPAEDSVATDLESTLGLLPLISWSHPLVIGYSVLMFLVRMLDFTTWTHDLSPALNSNAIFIYGAMGEKLGS